jgi:hypothetical protein
MSDHQIKQASALVGDTRLSIFEGRLDLTEFPEKCKSNSDVCSCTRAEIDSKHMKSD